ncbi:transmembrane protein [Arabidopsis thaliana]|uniref:Transmembrane protein n=1 Tax=Arabidopsis thaliana TaxID=3702 RepID=A0A1P8AVR2_ARATH|nr:uncharacterized protein AT1G74675 [Arabidopsis thaliana]ANM60732.1 transmembrane protein [Arabidopsis thaliana]|eukprot:NP_001322996.1 transmembrane protein [Arabidopsis thaliana]
MILIYMVSHNVARINVENYIMAIHRRGYHIVPSLMTSRLFSPVMHTWIISALVLMVAWKFDYGYTNEGLLFAPLYLLTTIGEMTTKIVSPSDKKLGCIVASLSHLWGGCTIFMLSFNSGSIASRESKRRNLSLSEQEEPGRSYRTTPGTIAELRWWFSKLAQIVETIYNVNVSSSKNLHNCKKLEGSAD